MAYTQSYEGHVRLLRKLLNSRIWRETTPSEKTILTTIILMTKDDSITGAWKGKEVDLPPGRIIATVQDIAYQCGPEIDESDIECALYHFENDYDFLKLKTDKKNPDTLLIKILNWRKYNPGGLTNEETEERKADAQKLYKYYVEKVAPARKTRTRSISNILKHTKTYSLKDLAKAVYNYSLEAKNRKAEFRKDPANFFGVNEPFFKDYLPEAFKEHQKSNNQCGFNGVSEKTLPPVLTPEKLNELNT